MKKINLKRAFDIAISAPALILSAPVILISAFTVATTNNFKNPILIQERAGLQNTPFKLYKIRTLMSKYNTNNLPLNNEYTTNEFCVFLRKSRIDELPQLINVLKGDMSLVGPRPLAFHKMNTQNIERQSVLPGITGTGQLKGTKKLNSTELLEIDLNYIRDCAKLSDFKHVLKDIDILIKTPFSLYKNRNVPHYRQAPDLEVSLG